MRGSGRQTAALAPSTGTGPAGVTGDGPARPAEAGPDRSPTVVAASAPAGADATAAGARSRRLASGIVTALLSRATGAVVPLVLIPITLSYLGAELYGLWMAATALTGMVAFADLGLGNGLMTKLAPCYAEGDTERARRYVSTAYLILLVVSATTCGLLWLLSHVIPWSVLLNADGTASPEDARAVALVCLTAFVLNIPLALVVRVQYAYQQVGRSNIWQAAGSLAALPLTLGAVHAGLPPVAVVAATVLGPVLVNLVNTGWMFLRQRPDIAPRPGAVDPRLARELLRLSGLFFLLTILWSAALQADTLVVAHALGLASVTAYAVPVRVFNLLGLLVTLVNLPLWPANGDALARGDLGWVRRTTRRMTLFSVSAVLLPAVGLVLVGGRLVDTWFGVPAGADPWLLGGLALWMVALAAVSPRAMVQNAAGVVRPQLLGVSLYLVLSVGAKWYGATRYGVVAVPYLSVVGYVLTVVPCTVYGYRRALTSAGGGPGRPRRTENRAHLTEVGEV